MELEVGCCGFCSNLRKSAHSRIGWCPEDTVPLWHDSHQQEVEG